MISPNKIIGSIVYRTRESLNRDSDFIGKLGSYYYSRNCYVKNSFTLWHYPGTNNEISNILLEIGQHRNGSYLKFPAILNFQPVRQEKRGNSTTLFYNLAIVGSVNPKWTTEQREHEVFEKLLRPIYSSFMNEIQRCGYFNFGYGLPSHSYYEVFTTGDATGGIIEKYGDAIDAIEIHNLSLEVKQICNRDIAKIDNENSNVTQIALDLLKLK